ncbi:hypothetical protein INR49_011684 [Caranx melampygus]|nr:hypothetical protein INR49_011684 [Caranx melampygus]
MSQEGRRTEANRGCLQRSGPATAAMWIETKTEVEEASRSGASSRRRVLNTVLLCTGDMKYLDKHMEDKSFVLQLVVWGLRGVARVILANNPLSGALILAALYWASPWQGLLGTLGVLVSTLAGVITGQDSCATRVLEPNGTKLIATEVLRGIPLGVGQIYACGALGPSLLILGAVLLYSPLLAIHSLLGSAIGTLVAFLSAYADIALRNLLGTLAWHRLAKERTSKMPSTQPHTPSSSSRMKLYSGHRPDVIETRGREEWRRMTEELTAAAYGEKHLHTTKTHDQTHIQYSYKNDRNWKQFLQEPRVELSLNTRPSERGELPADEGLCHQSSVPQVPHVRVKVIEHSPVGSAHHTTVELCYVLTQRQEPGGTTTPLINLRTHTCEDGGEPELRGKTGSLATAALPLNVEEQSDLSGVLQRDAGAEERCSVPGSQCMQWDVVGFKFAVGVEQQAPQVAPQLRLPTLERPQEETSGVIVVCVQVVPDEWGALEDRLHLSQAVHR